MLDFLFDLFADADLDVDVDVDDIDADVDEGLVPEDEDLAGVENGVFVGDEDDLEELAEEGEIDGTDHIASDDIVRNIAARNEFLALNGYDSIPEGYEVHHIVPLSEGGADTPDNMVLLSEEEHAQVTAMHNQFYDWHNQ